MAILSSGAISLNDVNIATSRGSGTPISMNTGAIRCITFTNTGATVSMSSLQAKEVAGGTINAKEVTTTSKGVTTTARGRVGSPLGTVTNGNISSIFSTVVSTGAWNPFQSSKASNSTNFGAGMSLITTSTSSVGYNRNFRLRIGNLDNSGDQNITVVFNFGTFIQTGASSGQAVYSLSTVPPYATTYFIRPEDLGVNRNWVICIGQ